MAINIIDRSGACAVHSNSLRRADYSGRGRRRRDAPGASHLPNITARQTIIPVLDSLIRAGSVTGDTGLKPTGKAAWSAQDNYG